MGLVGVFTEPTRFLVPQALVIVFPFGRVRFWVWRVDLSNLVCSSSGCRHTSTPLLSFPRRRSTHYPSRGKEPPALLSRYPPSFLLHKYLAGSESESEDLEQSGYLGEGFYLRGIRLRVSPSHSLPPHAARMRVLEVAEKRKRTSGDPGGGRRL